MIIDYYILISIITHLINKFVYIYNVKYYSNSLIDVCFINKKSFLFNTSAINISKNKDHIIKSFLLIK